MHKAPVYWRNILRICMSRLPGFRLSRLSIGTRRLLNRVMEWINVYAGCVPRSGSLRRPSSVQFRWKVRQRARLTVPSYWCLVFILIAHRSAKHSFGLISSVRSTDVPFHPFRVGGWLTLDFVSKFFLLSYFRDLQYMGPLGYDAIIS